MTVKGRKGEDHRIQLDEKGDRKENKEKREKRSTRGNCLSQINEHNEKQAKIKEKLHRKILT